MLERTGVWVEDEEARTTFAAGGADGRRRHRSGAPPAVPRRGGAALGAVAGGARGRDPKNDLVLEPGRVGFTNFGEGIQVVDPYTGELRESTWRTSSNAARVADSLGSVDVFEKAISVHDVPQETAVLYQAEACLANTSKHGFMGSGNGHLTRRLVEMAAAVARRAEKLRARPLLSLHHLPGEPAQARPRLLRDHHGVGARRRRRQHPLHGDGRRLGPGDAGRHAGDAQRRGARRPHPGQLTRKGAKVIYGSSTTAMDLRLASASVGSPECALISGAVAQLARFYLLPSWVAGA